MPVQRSCFMCGEKALQRKSVDDSDYPQDKCAKCEAQSMVEIQAKLAIGAVDDQYEQEADRVAELVSRPEQAEASSPMAPAAPLQISPFVQRVPVDEDAGGSEQGSETALEARLLAQAGAGRPLLPAVRRRMEDRFGIGLESVRVHTGGAAHRLADDIEALAFTHGRNIYFASGTFAPGTPAGDRLLSHELTHVVQQSAGAVAVQQQPKATNPSADERAAAIKEAEAAIEEIEEAPTTEELGAQSDAEDALKLKWSRHKDKKYAWAVGLKDRNRLQKTLDLSPKFQQKLTIKVGFFSGEAKGSYIQTISPALSTFPSEQVIAILSGRAFKGVDAGIGAQNTSCDISKQQFLLQYDGEPEKSRCMDLKTDAEFKRDYFENNITSAVGYSVKGTTWENVEYNNFKAMLVKYKKNNSEYFILDDLGNFHTGPTTAITLDHTYLKRRNGLIYPIYRNEVYFNEVLTPNLLSLKNGLKYQVKELKDLYTLLQTAGAFALNLGNYAVTAGAFETSINAFRRGPVKLAGRPLPGIRTAGQTSRQTTDLGGIPEPISDDAPTARMNVAEQQASGGEIVGDYRVVGTKTLNGKTFERHITGLYGTSGKQTAIGPIFDLAEEFIGEARTAGATELKITGDFVVNKNVLRIQRFAQHFGGTARQIGDSVVEITIPIR